MKIKITLVWPSLIKVKIKESSTLQKRQIMMPEISNIEVMEKGGKQ